MNLQLKRIDALKAGMIVARPVLSDNGKVLLDKGAVLTCELIQTLWNWQIPCVNIVTLDHGRKAKPDLQQVYGDALNHVIETFEKVRIMQEVPLDDFQEIVDAYISLMIDMVGVVESLYKIKHHSEYTYRHSLNVSILCGLMGKWLGMQDGELRKLILAGLMHDVGKACISKVILDKPGQLTDVETEVMRTHSQCGYRLVAKNASVPSEVKLAILQHHERGDGSGYPLGLDKLDISLTAKIVAIADIYDAMTSDRVYKSKLPPFAVVETLTEQMYQQLDPEICLTFVSNIRQRLMGALVKLNNGAGGRVVYINEAVGSRPVVQLQGGEYVNLEQKRELAIVAVLDEEPAGGM